jgi:hypothetical protein
VRFLLSFAGEYVLKPDLAAKYCSSYDDLAAMGEKHRQQLANACSVQALVFQQQVYFHQRRTANSAGITFGWQEKASTETSSECAHNQHSEASPSTFT